MFATINSSYTGNSYNNHLDSLNKVGNLKVSEGDATVKRIALFILNFLLTPFRAIQNIYYKNFKLKNEIKKESVNNSSFLNSAKEFVSKNQIFLTAAISSAVILGFIDYNYRKSLQPSLRDTSIIDTSSIDTFNLPDVVGQTSILPSSIYDLLKWPGWLLSPIIVYSIRNKSASIIADFYRKSKVKDHWKIEKCSHHKMALKGDLDIEVGKVYRRCIDCAKMVELDDSDNLKEKPLAAFIYTSTDTIGDHNGAFRSKFLQGDFEVISETHELLFSRVEDKLSFARVINFLEKFDNIVFVGVGGHGTEESIELGKWDIKETRDEKHLFSKIKRILKRNGTLYLSACSVGAEGGLAQRGSRILKKPLVMSSNRIAANRLSSLENMYDASKNSDNEDSFLIFMILAFFMRISAGMPDNFNPLIESLFTLDIAIAMSILSDLALNCFPKRFPRFTSFFSGNQMNYRNGYLIDKQRLLTKLSKLLPSRKLLLNTPLEELEELEESVEFRRAFSLILDDLNIDDASKLRCIKFQIRREAENFGIDPENVLTNSKSIIDFIEGPRKENIARAQIHFADELIDALRGTSGKISLESDLIQGKIKEIEDPNESFFEKSSNLINVLNYILFNFDLDPNTINSIKDHIMGIKYIQGLKKEQGYIKGDSDGDSDVHKLELLTLWPFLRKSRELIFNLKYILKIDELDPRLKEIIKSSIKEIEEVVDKNVSFYDKLKVLLDVLSNTLNNIRSIEIIDEKYKKLLEFNVKLISSAFEKELGFCEKIDELIVYLKDNQGAANLNDIIELIEEIKTNELPLFIKSEKVIGFLKDISNRSNLNLEDFIQKFRLEEPGMQIEAEESLFIRSYKLIEILKTVQEKFKGEEDEFYSKLAKDIKLIKALDKQFPEKARLINDAIINWLNLKNNPFKNLGELDLSNLGLRAILPCISYFENLTHLNFDGNAITSIPEDIFEMPSLGKLSFKNNKLAYKPRDVSNRLQRSFDTQGNELLI